MNKLKSGMIIRFKEDLNYPYKRNWIVLNVTQKDIDNGLDTDHIGLHCFGGLWYGTEPLNIKSYGKIDFLDRDYIIIHKNINSLSLEEIKKLIN